MSKESNSIFVENVNDPRQIRNRYVYDQLVPAWANRQNYSNLDVALIQAIAIIDLKYKEKIEELQKKCINTNCRWI